MSLSLSCSTIARAFALAAFCSLLPATAVAQGEPGATHEFPLEYRAQLTDRPFGGLEGMLTREILWDSARTPLPGLGGRKVRRGAIRIGDGRVVQLAWDEPGRQLFVDRDGNGDLAGEEPLRVVSFWSGGQIFDLVELRAPEGAERGKWTATFHLAPPGSTVLGSAAAVCSGWTGKIELGGAAYQLAVLDDLDGVFTPGSDRLCLRPWPEDEAVPSSSLVDLPERVLVGGGLYDLSLGFEAGGEGGVVRATFRESTTPLVDCELRGTHISRLLVGQPDEVPHPTAIFLEEPSGTLRLPAGEYLARIEIDGGALGPLRSQLGFVVKPEGENVLCLGAPLDNSLRFRRGSASTLELEYLLRGVGGEEYTLENHVYPSPRFVAHDGEREVASGDFRYG